MTEDELSEQIRLIEHSPVALLAVTLNGEVLAHNERMRMWMGAPDKEHSLRGRNLVEWLTPASRLLYESQVMPRLLDNGRVQDVILEVCNDLGVRIPLLASANLSTAPDGSQLIYVAVIDASARISFERELVEARRAADEAHERLTLLQDATSQLALAQGIDDLGAILVEMAGRASLTDWTSVRIVSPSSDLRESRYGSLATDIAASLVSQGSEPVACRDGSEMRSRFPELADSLASRGVEALLIVPISRLGADDVTTLGEIICAYRRPTPFNDDEVETLHALAAQAERVIEHLHLQDQIRHQALHDVLTGLPNRRLLAENLAQQLSEAARTGEPCSTFFIDLDGFKAINDVLGHAAGDAALRVIAGRLRGLCRAEDIVSRFGGDEFVVALKGVDEAAAREFAMRAQRAIRQPLGDTAAGALLSSSIGVMTWLPRAGERPPTAEELIDAADNAMYSAKRRGKDAVTLHHWTGPSTD
ncbi:MULTISPECIES: diguanylate cyclase [unclassified Leucobacter]|uniref:diguanylate cyclase n=1 Tax=unclassified Leucobacter TaxID=2621730 RepID=UPI00165D79C0|nr:diguanylate cyclase [Leucobacter sp. cx-87]